MKVLCLATDSQLAYLIKHVLVFEGYAVEVCRTVEAALEGLLEGAAVLVTTEPLPSLATGAARVVLAPPGLEPALLLEAVRAAAGGPPA